MDYLRLIPTVSIVLATFGALFTVVAALLKARFGTRAIWPFWGFYLTTVSVSCIYKLSGVRFGLTSFTAGRTIYLATVALVSLGLPLALSALVLKRTAQRPHVTSAGSAWAACVAMTPVAVSLVAVVDLINLMILTR
jgi:hypothetical protein